MGTSQSLPITPPISLSSDLGIPTIHRRQFSVDNSPSTIHRRKIHRRKIRRRKIRLRKIVG